ncbi:MAG: YjbQ family protein [Anaerolineae bacterium]|nr:YjbQ family protein [Phycisphaerae bacterium]
MQNYPIHRETISTRDRSQMIDVTSRVQALVKKSNALDGVVIVYCPHTTAAITINENADPDVQHDLLTKLEELVPKREAFYQHGEGNSDSHLKTAMLGNSATVLIEKGKLVLGQWQGIYFCEFDGPRERQMLVKIIET